MLPRVFRKQALTSGAIRISMCIGMQFPSHRVTVGSNLWGVFKDWWRHHGPFFSVSGENAFYQLWRQAVPRVTMVRSARVLPSVLPMRPTGGG
jgi:hypothetical protein